MAKLCQYLLVLLIAIQLSNGAENISNLLALYDLKVKNNEASCRLVNHPNLPENRRTLAGRGCMCDEECIKYKDCCKDAPYYRANEQSLPPSHQCNDFTAVYMKADCPYDWNDSETRYMCEKSTKPLDSEDIAAILPISNKKTREVYGNRHCAACHSDSDTENWEQFPMGVVAGEAPPGYLKPTYKVETTTSYTYPKPDRYYNKLISQVPNNELDEPGNENCNHNCKVKVINNIISHPPPGILLDIHLYVYNDSLVGGDGQWPVQLKTVVPNEDSETIFNNLVKRRSKRDSRYVIDFKKYSSKADVICSNPIYDKENREFVSRYENKNFICRFGPMLPQNASLFTRRCVPQMERKCPDGYENEAIKEECSIHTNIVYDKQSKKPYRNKDCARCHKKKDESLTGEPQETRLDFTPTAGTAKSNQQSDPEKNAMQNAFPSG